MWRALEEFHVSGVDTAIPFLRLLLNERHYVEGIVNTRWLEEKMEQLSFPLVAVQGLPEI
jgi:pyruvate carboxylase